MLVPVHVPPVTPGPPAGEPGAMTSIMARSIIVSEHSPGLVFACQPAVR